MHPLNGGLEAIGRAFVETHHYSTSWPAARLTYALTTSDEQLAAPAGEPVAVAGEWLVGVAVLSVPMSPAVLTGVFPQLNPYRESLELGRLVLTDTPANAETWFLARVFEQASATGIRGVVSFADPMPRTITDGHTIRTLTPGHVGLIYQALNGRACGRSTARTLVYLPRSGRVLSARTLQKIRASEPGGAAAERHLVQLGAQPRQARENPRVWLHEALSAAGATRVRHPGNYRYAWPVGPPAARRRVRIALPSTPYPKPATGLLPAHPARRAQLPDHVQLTTPGPAARGSRRTVSSGGASNE